ncbi:MAG TPA: flagellar basal body-associated FliL family protein [Armatimonadetes bacterium]|nr:flagellar basal body-associated FliL family protein [Armatimonadota bacterium]
MRAGKVPIVLLLSALFFGGGAALYGMALLKVKGEKGKRTGKNRSSEKTTLIDLGDFIVNLADKKSLHYLKARITLEVEGKSAKVVEEEQAKIQDAFISVLSSHTFSDLLPPKGKEALKEELKEAAEEIVGEGVIKGVYFTFFAME